MGAQDCVICPGSSELTSNPDRWDIARGNPERKYEPGVSRQGTVTGRRKKEQHIGMPGGVLEVIQAAIIRTNDPWPLLPQVQVWRAPYLPQPFYSWLALLVGKFWGWNGIRGVRSLETLISSFLSTR